jgi:hypothetical protein
MMRSPSSVPYSKATVTSGLRSRIKETETNRLHTNSTNSSADFDHSIINLLVTEPVVFPSLHWAPVQLVKHLHTIPNRVNDYTSRKDWIQTLTTPSTITRCPSILLFGYFFTEFLQLAKNTKAFFNHMDTYMQ